MNENPQIQELFTAEAKELATTLESAALALESRPDDAELINEVFRAAHSLKGAAAMLGLRQVAALTHALETMLDLWRSGELHPESRHFTALLRGADMLSAMLHEPVGGENEATHAELLIELEQLCLPGSDAGGAAQRLQGDDPARGAVQRLRVRFVPQADAFQWGGDPLLVFRELRGLSRELNVRLDDSALPNLSALNAEHAYFAWEIELELLPDVDLPRVQEAFSFFDGVAELSIEQVEAAVMHGPSERSAATPSATRSTPPRPAAADVTTLRVATEKVDKVIDLMGELVIAQAVVRELVRKQASAGNIELQEAVLVAERYLRDLQERVMSIRMLPVGAAFSRVPRVVRDLAHKLGKQVSLELMGTETELDKTLIDKVSDPLMHLVRNALDHGIEPPAERQARGKPPTARLQVRAYARGGNVFVEVVDDGRGLDRDRIRRKAIERGLMREDEHVREDQLWKFIFHPGFSTKQEVTEVSGRGVGLDVVQSTVDELGGELQVESALGAGTCFRLRLPLTLTILDGLLLCAAGQTCVLPLTDIAFSTRIRPGQAGQLAGSGRVLDLGAEVLPLVELSEVLGQSGGGEGAAALAVVVHASGYRYALGVDALLGQTQAVVKSLESHYRRVPGIMGATILGDGRVALILDGQGVATASGLQRRLDNSRAALDANAERRAGSLAENPARNLESDVCNPLIN